MGTPLHVPPEQVPVVHCVSNGLQSLAVPVHLPASQWSDAVQTSPSSQGASLGVTTHAPLLLSHAAMPHALVSAEQSLATPPWHVPPAHFSVMVQRLPSSQGKPGAGLNPVWLHLGMHCKHGSPGLPWPAA